MVTKILGLGPAHRFMGVTDVSRGTTATGGIQVESRDLVATLVTTIGTAAQRAEKRTWEVTHGILHTGNYQNVAHYLDIHSYVEILSEPLMFPYSRDDYDRYYRGGSGSEDYYRRKDEPYRDPYRDPWNGRREPEGYIKDYYWGLSSWL